MKTIIYNIESENKKAKLMRFLVAFGIFWCVMNVRVYSQIDTIQLDTLQPKIERIPVDTNVLETAKKIIIFREFEDGVEIERIEKATGDKKMILNIHDDDYKSKEDSVMRGHWSGFEYGVGNFLTADNSFIRPDGYGYLKQDMWRSWNFNINFGQSTTPIIKDRLAAVGGLGLEINNYTFLHKNNIQLDPVSDEIMEWDLENDYDVKKSKIRSMYLNMPLLLELQLGNKNYKDRFYISGGVIGGVRVGSMSKFVYNVGDNKQKLKENHKDLNMNRWRWGLHAKLGYSDKFNVFATYYVTPFFEKGKGPELYPFSCGFGVYFGE